jgi:hypothetical protein
MPAQLVKLRTRADRIKTAQAEQLRQLVLDFPNLPQRAVGELIATIDRQTVSKSGWTFVMLSPEQNAAVVDWLAENSSRPQVAMRLWAKLFSNLRTDTGEIVATRDELAELVGDNADNVSRVMGELASIGAISRRREKVAGMRGPGLVRYFMNPMIATNLTGAARDQAQAEAPLLALIEGGRP